MDSFNAVLNVEIKRVRGPEITDRTHILTWMVTDGLPLEGRWAGFRFDACIAHLDPDECDYACSAETSTYQATIMDAAPEDA